MAVVQMKVWITSQGCQRDLIASAPFLVLGVTPGGASAKCP